MFGDIFDRRILGRKEEGRDAARHAGVHRTVPHNKGLPSPNALEVLRRKNDNNKTVLNTSSYKGFTTSWFSFLKSFFRINENSFKP